MGGSTNTKGSQEPSPLTTMFAGHRPAWLDQPPPRPHSRASRPQAPQDQPPAIQRPEFQRTSTPVTGHGYDRPEGITSQSRYTLFRPSDCPDNPDHLRQLPGREAGDAKDRPPGRRRRGRTGPDVRGWPRRRSRARPPLEHHPLVQRPLRRHRVGGPRSRSRAHHRDHPRSCRRGQGLQERARELGQGRRTDRTRQGSGAGGDGGDEG